MDHQTICYDADAEIDEIILRLDLTLVRPDDEDDQDDHLRGVGPTGPNGAAIRRTPDGSVKTKSGKPEEDKKKSGALGFIKKLGHKDGKNSSSSEATAVDKHKILSQVKVENLPQKFIVKYIGCKACRGLWGIQHTREPVDGLVEDLHHLERGEDLPLVRLDVSTTGITIAVHPRSRARRPPVELGLLPLQFISYAVQDNRYLRVFAFILVREMSSRGRATECHAYLCDSALTARRMALSVALAFRAYEASLEGRPFKFAVDLRSADELSAETA